MSFTLQKLVATMRPAARLPILGAAPPGDACGGCGPLWDSGVTYTIGNFVLYNGVCYMSLTNANLGNQPDTDGGVHWRVRGPLPGPVPVTIDLPHLTFYQTWGEADAGMAEAERTQPLLFSIGGALWTIGEKSDSPPPYLWIYKSADNGLTWTAIDPTNAPQLPSIRTVAAEVVGNTIYILYLHIVGGVATGLRVAQFDTVAGLWGAETADAPATGSAAGHDVRLFEFHATAANTFNVVYTDDVAGSFKIWLVQYAAGVWGVATQLGADITNPLITGYFVDAAATAHLTYSGRQAFGVAPLSPNPVRHLSIAANGAVSASDVVFADAIQNMPANFNFTWPSFGIGAVFAGKVILPYALRTASGYQLPAVAVRSGGVWSSTTLSDQAHDQIDYTAGAITYALVVGTTLYILWVNGLPGTLNQIRYVSSADGVTFSAPATLYDALRDPPPNMRSTGGPYNPSICQFSANALGAVFTFTDTGFNSLRAYVALSLP